MSSLNRGRPKKKKRGPAPEFPDADGDAVGFRNLSVNSKRSYWKTRREDDPPQAPVQGTRRRTLSLDMTSPPPSTSSGQQSVGRPALDPEKGPMREASLRKGEQSSIK